MRIALCTDIYLPQLSGISDCVDLLANSLSAHGHAVRTFGPRIPGAAHDEQVARFWTWFIPGSAQGLVIIFPFGLTKALRDFKPDVIHVHTYGTIGFAALLAGWRLRIPVVATDHTSPADYLHYAKIDFAWARWLIRSIAAWFHMHCDAVTAPSRHILEELQAYGMHNVPCTVISNPVPLDMFRPLSASERSGIRKRLGITAPAIVLFGRIAKEKNLDYALDIIEEAKRRVECMIVLIGGGPYRETLKRHIAHLGLASITRDFGVMRGEELARLLNAADVHLITSTSEIQPMTVLQTMACGIPTVAARAGGLPEYVEDGKSGFLIESTGQKGAVEKLCRLLEDPELRGAFGKRAQELTAPYQPTRVMDMFLDVYEKVRKHL